MPSQSPGGKDESVSRLAKLLLAFGAVLGPLVAWFIFRHRHVQAAPSAAEIAWDRLIAFDAERRDKVDFAKVATWDQKSGPDPYVIRAVPGSPRLVGILHGGNALVVLDASMHELQRL